MTPAPGALPPDARRWPPPLVGPAFGSYDASEVAWLLTDLSAAALESPVEEREEAIQSGGAHYAESLPHEYQPSPEYRELFRASLRAGAERVAKAVGTVTDLVLATRGTGAVLASLARAGTPIGILMRRWALRFHGVELPHYAVSIVRGRGIDAVALGYLAARHRADDVVFVDGWTGKGAITRELAAAVDAVAATTGHRFDPRLVVLADPGGCVELSGTREDFLIPSACLNSTVSGLVSRTVLNDRLIGPGHFHGAKFYGDLAPDDVSQEFLDVVSSHFDGVRDRVSRLVAERSAAGVLAPTWSGARAVARICATYGIDDPNLVKPGIGETTRVLLRRVPWRVLVREQGRPDLAHVRLLAQQRGVPLETVPWLPYSCVGLIHPAFTRGATGAQGTAAVQPGR